MPAEDANDETSSCDYEAIVIGTGFGGAVTACRLAEAGVNLCILERGRRYGQGDFPRLDLAETKFPDTSRWLWDSDQGLWDVRNLREMVAVQAAGYGGGSLVYANVHLRPPAEVFDGAWPSSDPNHAYTRDDLDRYYDLVAHVLEVEQLPEEYDHFPEGPIRKTEQMKEAAAGLGRSTSFFRPPLAVNFDAPGRAKTNKFHRQQHGCTACGECDIGCQIHAKNTLDLNYLAVAEDAPTTDVRTLAEVFLITKEGTPQKPVYRVDYRDHLLGGREKSIRSERVFLCAGSVNSTELLLKCDERGVLPLAGKELLGTQYFANGDGLALVYDTETSHEPTRGPTITTCILYDEPEPSECMDQEKNEERWFLLQEGGYPKSLETVMGVFRAPAWLERNAFPAENQGENPGKRAAQERHIPSLRERVRSIRFLYEWLVATRNIDMRVNIKDDSDEQLLPAQLVDAIHELYRRLHTRETHETRYVIDEVIEEVRERWLDGKWPRWLFAAIASCAESQVRRYVLPVTLDVTRNRYWKLRPDGDENCKKTTLDTESALDLASIVIEKFALGVPPDDHAAVLLVMGRDRRPGELRLGALDAARGHQLRAHWELDDNIPLYTLQERLMRDVANELRGELRLNPNYSIRNLPVTAHSLGGCPMGEQTSSGKVTGVTDPYGEVFGCPGLYVMDGAIIPQSVGTNPSSTIAAIAERNVAYQIEKIWGKQPTYDLNDFNAIPQGPDPLGAIQRHASAPPRMESIGLEFTEFMNGFYAAVDGPASTLVEDAERGEAAGREAGQTIRMELTARIKDLNFFLADVEHVVHLDGKIFLGSNQKEQEYAARGHLKLLKMSVGSTPDDPKKRTLEYGLDMHCAKTGQAYQLNGLKIVFDDPGHDLWPDVTRLYFRLDNNVKSAGSSAGIVRVHFADFFGRQLRSFHVTGTTDAARVAWALGRFTQFYLGNLREIYYPDLGKVFNPFGSSF